MTIARKNLMILYTAMLALCAVGVNSHVFALDHHGSEAMSDNHLRVYTHGDTRFAYFTEDKRAAGPVNDLMQCAGENMPLDYEIAFAPLSRAGGIVDSMEHAVWFPSGGSDDPQRKARMIGPVGKVKFLWYQRKTDAQDPTDPHFKETALVTAYKGSAYEQKLRAEGYRWIEGSADHNRLLSMLLSGKIDAILAVDFIFKLKGDTKRAFDQHVHTTEFKGLPVYFEASQHMVENEPEFIDSLRTVIQNCQAK